MTGFDIALIVVLIGFALLGLKHGSVWIISCLVGGFLGAFLIEYYQLPVADMMGGSRPAQILAGVLLFGLGLLIAGIPGWVVSRMANLFCVGAFDKILGVFAGLLAGLIAVTLGFMVALPHFPSIERSASWRGSKLARPLCGHLQDFFGHPSRRRATITEEIKDGITEQVTPLVNKTTSSIKESAQNVEHNVAKKADEVQHSVTKRAKAVGKAVTGAK